MPTNLKFKISNPADIKNKLIQLGFKFIESKAITDIYLESKENETNKLRIDSETAKLITFKRLESGELRSEPTIIFDSIEHALHEINSKEKIDKTLKKQIDIFTRGTSRAIIHIFEAGRESIYFSLEEDDEVTALEVLSHLKLDINNQILKSFDKLKEYPKITLA